MCLSWNCKNVLKKKQAVGKSTKAKPKALIKLKIEAEKTALFQQAGFAENYRPLNWPLPSYLPFKEEEAEISAHILRAYEALAPVQ